jgi:hypothetical protein
VRENASNSSDGVREGADVEVSVSLPAELVPRSCLELRFVGVRRGGPAIFLRRPEGDVDVDAAGSETGCAYMYAYGLGARKARRRALDPN